MNETQMVKTTATVELDDTQKAAIEICCDIEKRLAAVTGQAGTGKTTIMKRVFDLLTDSGYTIALCAPTGKAARRISEVTGIPAVTIHRLLEYPHPGERDAKTGKALRSTEPKRDRYNPLEYDVILADEYAMVNQEVHRNLIDALPRAGCLRAFGDINQLPPIEKIFALRSKPSPFYELIEKFDSVTLETIHRQDEGSGIVANGARILNGRIPSRLDDFTMHITDGPVDSLRNMAMKAIDSDIMFNDLDNQIITPTNKTWVGTQKLNTMLQNVFRKETTGWVDLPRHTWVKEPLRVREGDKVIWTENDYHLNIFNGESGIIKNTDTDDESFTIDFGDREVIIPPIVIYVDFHGTEKSYDPRRSVELAYAITTHKAQGSEYKRVVYVLNKSSMFIQTRSNFYTAVTRARERVHLITDMRSLQFAPQRTISMMEQKDRAKRRK